MERASRIVVVDILELALQFGIPAIIDIINAWDKDEITDEDIANLGMEMEMRSTDALREPSE